VIVIAPACPSAIVDRPPVHSVSWHVPAERVRQAAVLGRVSDPPAIVTNGSTETWISPPYGNPRRPARVMPSTACSTSGAQPPTDEPATRVSASNEMRDFIEMFLFNEASA
jgi:hypothetical protein